MGPPVKSPFTDGRRAAVGVPPRSPRYGSSPGRGASRCEVHRGTAPHRDAGRPAARFTAVRLLTGTPGVPLRGSPRYGSSPGRRATKSPTAAATDRWSCPTGYLTACA